MFDISWGEMALIGVVALIVIKPEDLPATLRGIGQMVGKVRRMAADFQGQFNQALREAEADKFRSAFSDLKGDVDKVTGFNPVTLARDQLKSAVEGVKAEVQGPPPAPPGLESQLPPPPSQVEAPLTIATVEPKPKPKRTRTKTASVTVADAPAVVAVPPAKAAGKRRKTFPAQSPEG